MKKIENMKTHKIRGVEKSVCCREQRIAYNYAFQFYMGIKEEKIEQLKEGKISEQEKNDMLENFTDKLKKYCEIDKIGEKYNIEAIVCAFRAGFIKFLEQGGFISRGEQIGRIFHLKI